MQEATTGLVIVIGDEDIVPPQSKKPKLSDIWVSNGYYRLFDNDRAILKSSDVWLNDRLINAGQELLKVQHKVSGLQDVCVAMVYAYCVQKDEFLQILNDGSNHWITISTLGCKQSEVLVFDSMHMRKQKANCYIENQVATLLKSCNKTITLKYADVQRQSDVNDCGLFALVFATDIVNKRDPRLIKFRQAHMRNHLLECLKSGYLSMFPTFSAPRRPQGILSLETFEIFCICRMPSIPPMVECSTCHSWFHTACVEVPEEAIQESEVPWFCSSTCSIHI